MSVCVLIAKRHPELKDAAAEKIKTTAEKLAEKTSKRWTREVRVATEVEGDGERGHRGQQKGGGGGGGGGGRPLCLELD